MTAAKGNAGGRSAREKLLSTEPVPKLLVRFGFPAVIGMFVNALYNLVDTIFVGHGVGPYAIGGLAIAFPYQLFLYALAAMIGVGAASIVSRALGAKQYDRASNTASNALVYAVAASLVLTVVGYLFIDQILEIFGATEGILDYARDYLGIVMSGTTFLVVAVVGNSLIRAEGRAMIAMVSMLSGAVVNIILDPIFIFALDMGVRGAAYATLIARFVHFAFAIGLLRRGGTLLTMKLGHFVPRVAIWREITAIGVPTFVRQIGSSVLAVVVNNVLRVHGGAMGISVFGAINRLLMFGMMPIFGVAQGFQPIVGFNYGARLFGRVRETVKGSLFFLISMIFPRLLISMFTTNQEMIDLGGSAMRIIVLFVPAIGLQMIGPAFFMAIGKPVPAFFLSLSRQIIFLIPLVMVLPNLFGLSGLWVSFPIADGLSSAFTALLLSLELRRLKRRESRTTHDA